jgi:guanylate kinase
MKQFNKDILHWKKYDYVVINDNLKNCYKEVNSLIESEVNKTKNNYNIQLVEKHVNQLVI